MTQKTGFTIVFPPGWISLLIALGIVYNWKLALGWVCGYVFVYNAVAWLLKKKQKG